MTDHVAMRRIGTVAEAFLGVVEERKRRGGVEIVGTPTGFWRIDEWTGGLQPDQLWVVGARSGVGKTALALDVALNVARQGVGTLFYSLEMSGESLVKRLLARMTDIAGGRIERGKLTDDEYRRLRVASEELDDLRLAVVDVTLSSEQLVEHALRTSDRSPVGFVVIDYVSLLRDGNKFGETQRIGGISQTVRALARPDHLDAPVMLLAQLNRLSEHREDHTPHLSDLKDSGQLEQDASVVLMPYRPYVYERMKGAPPLDEEADAMVIVAKNREGPTGGTRATFYPRHTRWSQNAPEAVEPRSLTVEGRNR